MPTRREWLVAATGFIVTLVISIILLNAFGRYLDHDYAEPVDPTANYAPKG